jgi:hypothetical protein
MKPITISTGTYNCADYRIIKQFVNEKSAIKFLQSIGRKHIDLFNDSWNFYGTNYKLTLNF